MGQNSWFGPGSEVKVLSNYGEQPLESFLAIGDHVSATARCRITCAGKVTIGNDVLLAPDVCITDYNYGMNPNAKGGYINQPLIVNDVTIKDGVWLGQRACIMPGVQIGAHSIIGANSVVTHDIPAYCIAVGSPAKVIKHWDKDMNIWVSVKP